MLFSMSFKFHLLDFICRILHILGPRRRFRLSQPLVDWAKWLEVAVLSQTEAMAPALTAMSPEGKQWNVISTLMVWVNFW